MPARKKSEQDIGKMIRAIGGDWKKFEDRRFCPHCRQLIYRVDNQPYDGIGIVKGKAFPIEVKSAKLSFPFADIKEHQREGLGNWVLKHLNLSWLALQMGTHRAGSQHQPRRMWLISWGAWLQLELLIKDTTGLVSLPYDANTKGVRLKIREAQLGAVQALKNWELTWTNQGWFPPDNHLFCEMYDIKPMWNRTHQLNPDGSNIYVQ